jgi:tetratricopeptide (TPR) repeat protein
VPPLPFRPAAALLLSLSCLTTASADERWVEVRSPHFHIVGNVPFREARRAALRLERFRATVARILPDQPLESAAPSTVLLFKDAASFRPFSPLYQGRPQRVSGLFVGGWDRNYFALDVQADAEGFKVLFHEYVHLLVTLTPLPVPLWMNEGLAEFYSTADVEDEAWTRLGLIVRPHVTLLRDARLIPLDTFFAVDENSPHYNEAAKNTVFYAQAWALVHYVMMGGLGDKPLLNTYQRALARGLTPAEACREAFGRDPAALQRELENYVHRLRFDAVRVPVEALPDAQLTEARLGPAAAQLYQGDFLVHTGRLEEARPFLERAMALDPASAEPYWSMGLGHHIAKDYPGAVRWLSGAVERNPRHGPARYLRAHSSLLAAGASFGPAAAATLREDLQVAVEAEPRLKHAWQLLAHVQSVLGDTSDGAVRILRRVVQDEPLRFDAWARLIDVLLRRGDLDEAQRTAGSLRARARNTQERNTANLLLVRVTEARQARDTAHAAAASPAPVPPETKTTLAAESPAVRTVSGRLVRMNCLPGGRLEFVVDAPPERLRLRAQSAGALIVLERGRQVQPAWPCGAMSLPVVARYWPDAGDRDDGTVANFMIERR